MCGSPATSDTASTKLRCGVLRVLLCTIHVNSDFVLLFIFCAAFPDDSVPGTLCELWVIKVWQGGRILILVSLCCRLELTRDVLWARGWFGVTGYSGHNGCLRLTGMVTPASLAVKMLSVINCTAYGPFVAGNNIRLL